MLALIFCFLQGCIEDNEEVEEYSDIADILDEYDKEEGYGTEASNLEEEKPVDLIQTIFCDVKKILREIDEEAGDEVQRLINIVNCKLKVCNFSVVGDLLILLSEVTEKLSNLKIKNTNSEHVPQAEGLLNH